MTRITYRPEEGGETRRPPLRSDSSEIYRFLCSVAAVLLLVALLPLPYGYYTFLRIVVCGTAGYGAYLFAEDGRMQWTIALGLLAVLFNPIIPIYLDRTTWAILDLAAAVVLLMSGRSLVNNQV
jgi:hypothetical protein